VRVGQRLGGPLRFEVELGGLTLALTAVPDVVDGLGPVHLGEYQFGIGHSVVAVTSGVHIT